MERIENKLKYKLMERQLDELAIDRSDYSKRVDQKLLKKFGKLNQINDNLKIMDCSPVGKAIENSGGYTESHDKKVRYPKAELAVGDELEVDEMARNYETEMYDEYRQDMNSQSSKKNDFIHMAVHYKNLCRVRNSFLISDQLTRRWYS